MIFGYPDDSSVLPGSRLSLRVSTDAPEFRVDFYRCGAAPSFKGGSGWLAGRDLPHHLPYQDWGVAGTGLHDEELPGWPAYTFPVPPDWESGTYIVVLVEGDGRGREIRAPGAPRLDARHSRALFVVKSAAAGAARSANSRAAVLYKLPLLTYHAYNQVSPQGYNRATQRGTWCLYCVPKPDDVPISVPPTVSLRRPGGGTGAMPWDVSNFDPFDPTPRQTFAHWDAPFIAWLEENGYRVEYCTDVDIHHDADLELLGRYRLLLSVGHDEYWSDPMRDNVERFIREGGNVAFFGGNTCWWQISFDNEFTFRRVGIWSDPAVSRPENTLTGVSYRNGGERDFDNNPVPVGYRVQFANHWAYGGTGLREGDSFGHRPYEYIVGYECDGAHFDRRLLGRGAPVNPTGDDGTPENFTILGIGDVTASGWGLGNGAATMGVYENNGTVFTAATTDWARVLARGTSWPVERITRNVLDRLG
jgi:hypothetical protein